MAKGNEGASNGVIEGIESDKRRIEAVESSKTGESKPGDQAGDQAGIDSTQSRSTNKKRKSRVTKDRGTEIPRLAILELPEEKNKPEKKAKRVTIADKELSEDIQVLLESGFNFVSIKAGDHWKISKPESKLISDPLTRILKRLGVSKTASKYMDYFSLITGTAVIVIPRLLITTEENKKRVEKSNDKKGEVQSGYRSNIDENAKAVTPIDSIKTNTTEISSEFDE